MPQAAAIPIARAAVPVIVGNPEAAAIIIGPGTGLAIMAAEGYFGYQLWDRVGLWDALSAAIEDDLAGWTEDANTIDPFGYQDVFGIGHSGNALQLDGDGTPADDMTPTVWDPYNPTDMTGRPLDVYNEDDPYGYEAGTARPWDGGFDPHHWDGILWKWDQESKRWVKLSFSGSLDESLQPAEGSIVPTIDGDGGIIESDGMDPDASLDDEGMEHDFIETNSPPAGSEGGGGDDDEEKKYVWGIKRYDKFGNPVWGWVRAD